MNEDELVEDFWESLGGDQSFYTEPDTDQQGRYMMRTRQSYIFDTAFWDEFKTYPFRIIGIEPVDGVLRMVWVVDPVEASRPGSPASDLFGDD